MWCMGQLTSVTSSLQRNASLIVVRCQRACHSSRGSTGGCWGAPVRGRALHAAARHAQAQGLLVRAAGDEDHARVWGERGQQQPRQQVWPEVVDAQDRVPPVRIQRQPHDACGARTSIGLSGAHSLTDQGHLEGTVRGAGVRAATSTQYV